MPGTPGIETIVFTDMVGSTAVRSRMGEEQADRLRRIHDGLLGARVEANRGRIIRWQGDGLVAVFPAASDALTAAVEMQQAVASYNRRRDALAELAIRVGVSVGEVSWEDDDCFGIPMVEAARLEAAADPAQILCSDYVRVMARGRGGHAFRAIGFLDLKGLPEPVAACEVVWEPCPDEPPLPLPHELAVDASRPFVGRAAELECAEKLLADDGRERLSMLWLLGEPGIGKTRLATEISRRVHSAGGIVLFGRCSEDLAVPYQPFLEALRWYVERIPGPELADRLGETPAELLRLVPEIGARLPGLRSPPPAVPEVEQYRLFDAVRTWLAAAAEGRPLVLVLDDVQWASRPTLALLAHVARTAEPSRAVLVCTARTTAPDDNEALASLADDLDRRGAPGHRLELTGLELEAVHTLVVSAAQRPLDDGLRQFAAALHRDTAGNPLFVDALLEGLAAGPAEAPAALHPSLATAVARRVARLPGDAAELLRTASVVGLAFDAGVVAMAAGCDDAGTLGSLESAGQAGLVDEDGVDRYRFRHALVRSVLRDQLSRSRRVRFHLRVGEAIEAVHHDDIGEHAAALAHHFGEAVALGGAPKAYRYSILAAEHAGRLLSHQEAVGHFGRALELVDQARGGDPMARYTLLVARSEAQRRAGDMLGALDTLSDAANEAAARRAPEALARAAVAFEETTFWLGAPGHDALDLSRRAVDALPPGDSALRALALATLCRSLETSGRVGSPEADQARAMAERLGDTASAFAVQLRTTRSATSVERAEASSADWLGLTRQAQAIGDTDTAMLGLAQTMWASLMAGDRQGWNDLFTEFERLAVSLRQPRWECWLSLLRAARALLSADLSAAEEHLEHAEQIGEGFGWAREGLYGVAMFLIRRDQGRLPELAPVIQATVRLAPTDSMWRPGLAVLYAALGKTDEARTEFEALVSGDAGSVPSDGMRDLHLGLVAEVCAAVSDANRAPWVLDLLRPCEGRFLIPLTCAAGLGPTDRLLGMLASTAGRPGDAERWHRSGLDLARRMESPLWVAHCLHEYGAHLLTTDQPRGAGLLNEAARLCHQHALDGLGARVEALVSAR
jgi:class 3 adenylate cyclase